MSVSEEAGKISQATEPKKFNPIEILPGGVLRPINSGTQNLVCYYYICEQYLDCELPECPLGNQIIATNSEQDKICPLCKNKRRLIKAEYHIKNRITEQIDNFIVFNEFENYVKNLRTIYFRGFYPGDAETTFLNHHRIKLGFNYPDGRPVEFHEKYGPPKNNYLRTQFSFGHNPCPPITGSGDENDGQFPDVRPKPFLVLGKPRTNSPCKYTESTCSKHVGC